MVKKKRKRVSRDKIRENAESGSRGGSNWFNTPEGVGRYNPEKAGRVNIDILPYEVASKAHPDDVEQECLWYKLPFMVHHGLGVNNASLVCPRSLSLPCPICEERDRLYKEDSDKHEDVIDDLRPQKFVVYNIKDPEDTDKVALMAMSRGKFAVCLEDELKDPENTDQLNFFDTTEDGRTLRVRFSNASYEGRKYLEATKIDFKERGELDEDEILDSTVCLEEVLIITPYDKLKAIFLQEDEETKEEEPEEEEEDDTEEEDTEEEDTEEDDTEEEEEDDTEEPEEEDDLDLPFEKNARVITEEFGLAFPGTVFSILKDGNIKVQFDDGDSGKYAPSDLSLLDPKDDPKDNAYQEEEPEEEEEDDTEEEEPEEEEPEEESKAKKAKKGKTPKCPAKGGKFGQVDQYDECDPCPVWNECEAVSA